MFLISILVYLKAFDSPPSESPLLVSKIVNQIGAQRPGQIHERYMAIHDSSLD